jgi:hypothetical protein
MSSLLADRVSAGMSFEPSPQMVGQSESKVEAITVINNPSTMRMMGPMFLEWGFRLL